jgi:hypothetical protein
MCARSGTYPAVASAGEHEQDPVGDPCQRADHGGVRQQPAGHGHASDRGPPPGVRPPQDSRPAHPGKGRPSWRLTAEVTAPAGAVPGPGEPPRYLREGRFFLVALRPGDGAPPLPRFPATKAGSPRPLRSGASPPEAPGVLHRLRPPGSAVHPWGTPVARAALRLFVPIPGVILAPRETNFTNCEGAPCWEIGGTSGSWWR